MSKSSRAIVGVGLMVFTFIVRAYPAFFLEYGKMHTERGLILWSWSMFGLGVFLLLSIIIPFFNRPNE